MKRTQALIWKEFRQLRNDPMTIRLMVLPIIAQLFILGYALTTEVKNTPVAILNRCTTPQSRELCAVIEHNPLFKMQPPPQSEADLRTKLDRDEIKVGVIIPADFSRNLLRPQGATVNLIIDGQDANSALVASGYLNTVISGWAMKYFSLRLQKSGIRLQQIVPVSISTAVLFNPLLQSSWYMIPAMAVILVTMITALLTGFSLVKEKEAGTLEQLMVTPVSTMQVLIGKTVPYVAIGLIQLTLMLTAGALWFGIPMRGNPLTLLLMTLIYLLSSLGIGILTSTIARTAQQVLFLTWFFLLFFILLSGFFMPIENMPHWVQQVSIVNPVRYYLQIIREIFLKGSGISELCREGVHMLIIGVVVFGGALMAFKRKVG